VRLGQSGRALAEQHTWGHCARRILAAVGAEAPLVGARA
jgi:hypothetical protein